MASDRFFPFRTPWIRVGKGTHRIIVRVSGLIACKVLEFIFGVVGAGICGGRRSGELARKLWEVSLAAEGWDGHFLWGKKISMMNDESLRSVGLVLGC